MALLTVRKESSESGRAWDLHGLPPLIMLLPACNDDGTLDCTKFVVVAPLCYALLAPHVHVHTRDQPWQNNYNHVVGDLPLHNMTERAKSCVFIWNISPCGIADDFILELRVVQQQLQALIYVTVIDT